MIRRGLCLLAAAPYAVVGTVYLPLIAESPFRVAAMMTVVACFTIAAVLASFGLRTRETVKLDPGTYCAESCELYDALAEITTAAMWAKDGIRGVDYGEVELQVGLARAAADRLGPALAAYQTAHGL